MSEERKSSMPRDRQPDLSALMPAGLFRFWRIAIPVALLACVVAWLIWRTLQLLMVAAMVGLFGLVFYLLFRKKL